MTVVRVTREGDLAWVVIDNPPVNATSTVVRKGLARAVREVQGARLAVLRCEGRTFIAGGDISEFDQPPEEPHLPDVVDMIEASATPFAALCHGNVLGGGLEVAMACAFRIASPGTRFGLPEVNVGLVPGAGGTQRAPRLFGWEAAVDMACWGRLLTADEALSLGAIDAVVTDPVAYVRGLTAPRPETVSARLIAPPDPNWLAGKRLELTRRARGQSAPLHNLDALQWASLPYSQGQSRERALHLDLRASSESRALRHVFFAERTVARPDLIRGHPGRTVGRVAVVGGGLMGAGIAAACLDAGLTVSLIERDDNAASAARDRVIGLIASALDRGKIDRKTHDARVAAFVAGSTYSLAGDADLAIEAVFEDTGIKNEVFRALAKVMASDAMLATNTSYLDPHEIFRGIPGLERCIGLHFFSPAHVMKLLEVVRLSETLPGTVATAFLAARHLGKVAVLSGVCDGFIGNRMLANYRRAAEYMLADGAYPHQIDSAMKAFGMAMGPFEAQDMAGLQIAEANRRRQDETRDPRERYVDISDRLCALTRFGQRSGAGWYRYLAGSRTPERDGDVEALIDAFSSREGITRRSFSESEIQGGLLAALTNEGARIVEDGIAENDDAVDIVQIHGYGFPRWRGGPMHKAKVAGDEWVKSALDNLDADSPGSWVRAARYL